LWLPLLLLSGLIWWMYHVLAHRPGGQPIGALEWFFTKTAKYVRQTARAMPRPRRQAPGAAL
jgi:lipopolysaccharide export system permease protein